MPIVVNNTVFKEVYTEIENVDALTVGEDTEYLEYTAPELFEHICKCRESSTTIDEFLRQIADYGLDYHNFKGVTLAEVNKFLNREIKFSSTLPYIIRGVDYAYQKFDDSKSSEPGDSEQKIQYKSVPLDPAFYAYIDGLFVNSNSITASDGSGTYSRINFSLMAKVVINDETFKVVIPINKNISVIDPNDLL
ncbi:hypothetical protein H6794_03065 [Candidatus Nomurabacteria bacterium]|nr:hypothetical protein [Candidatus Saccharibacteria bacterium]MCB9839809.1 hypothetical protein [Candidatus Nomurabacteria bacterium]